MIASAVNVLATLTSLGCALLLFRGYVRGRSRLLFWSGLCFCGLALSNFLVFLDLALFPEMNLYRWRLITAAISSLLIVYGLIWERE